MKPSLDKLYKFFKLEIDRGYDNHAVLGGLERILDRWQDEARLDGVPEDLIQVISERLKDYSRLSATSRAESLEGLWKRIARSQGLTETLPTRVPSAENPPKTAPAPAPNRVERTPTAAPARQTAHNDSAAPASVKGSGASLEQTPAPKQTIPDASQVEPVDPVALGAPVTVLPGVGPRYAQNLARLSLYTLRDLLYFLPRRYDDYTQLKPINRLSYGEEVTVIGTVVSIAARSRRGGKEQDVEGVISDGAGSLRVIWFNQIWIAKRLHQGMHIVLSGKVDQYLGRLVMNSPDWEPLEAQSLSTNRIVPVYPLTASLTQRWLRRTIHEVVTYCAPRIQDPLPERIRREAGLVSLSRALFQVHFPDSWDDLQAARARLAFDEIFLLQMGVLRQKRAWQERIAVAYPVDSNWLAAQQNRLPFPLTGAQQRAVQDIQQDLSLSRPMNRLIQGDVGSGKTVVAAMAIATVVHHSAQAALMAPTSILAEQHYRNMLKLLAEPMTAAGDSARDEETLPAPPLEPHQIRLLIGATSEPEKRQIRQELAEGRVRLLVGTHALIEDPVQFQNFQLAVVDEQHRFGVNQRASLRAKGENPHLLVMTATPIPRSLALTVYGDLDVTIIDEMPPGRQPVETHVVVPRDRERVYSLIRSQVKQGRQAFIIYPLVEESEKSDAKAAVEDHTRLQNEFFPDLRLGLLHGRMPPDEKDRIMTGFRDGEYQILVSTSVVEVGVDVPNATVMVIEGANRFGLAQLHQFRGRVGRGAEKSYCILIPDSPDAAENERLQVMVETNDGFVLAERDLEQRGPGQFLGTRQAGFTELSVANLSDIHLIEKARRFARELFDQDPDLSDSKNALLRSNLLRAWGESSGDIS